MDPTTAPNPTTLPPEGVVPVIREHVVVTPGTCGGKPRIAGTRIQVKHVAILHEREGRSPAEIVDDYPHLTLADVHAALAYYHDHRAAIDAEIEADRAWYEEQRATQPALVRDALNARKADAADDSLPPG